MTTTNFTPDHNLDVAVIGGGQAGLAMAWHLRQLGMRFAVLDAGTEIGSAWRSRWDSLRLFTPARYDSLPGLPFPGSPDRYPTKDEVAGYLRDYVAAFDLPIHLGCRVTRLVREGDGHALVTAQGTVRARDVVVATGPFQSPHTPATGLDPAVTQLHSSSYRNPDGLPLGPVLVVGDGNSGRQIARELAMTRRVELATAGAAAVVPQRLLGRDLFWWLDHSGLLGAPATSRIGQRMRARGELVVGTTDRMLRDSGVTLRPRLAAADGTTVQFADGTGTDVDTVVWATGYRPDHSWIDVQGALVDGRPIHDRGVSPVPGLHFLGLPWQHSRGSALLGFVGSDAAHVVDRIAARHTRTPAHAS